MRSGAGRAVAALISLLAIVGCDRSGPKPAGRLQAFATVPPLAYIVERIGGERVEAAALIGPNQDPHTYEPTPRQVMALAKSRVFFKVGLPLEEQILAKLQTAGGLEIVDVTTGIEPIPTADLHSLEDGADHAADHPGHGPNDPHVWLSAPLLMIVADNILAKLIELDPPGADAYRRNAAELKAQLQAIHARTAAELAPDRGRSFIVFHPAFAYFARTYGLRQVPIQIQGETPSPKQLEDLIALARTEKVKVVYVQPQFDPRTAQMVAQAIGGEVAPLDDLAADAPANLVQISAKLKAGFERSDRAAP